MVDGSRTTRRRLLATCAGLVGVGTAGCQGYSPFGGGAVTGAKGSKDEGETPTDTPTVSETPTPSDAPVGAVGTTVEDFDGGAAAWTANSGVGTDSGVQSGVVKDGVGALELINIGGPGYDGSYTSLPGDGLAAYPAAGDALSIWTRTDGGDRPKLGLCYLWQDRGSYTQNDGSGYVARLNVSNDEVELAKSVDGSTEMRASTTAALSHGVWYRLVVETTEEGRHRLTVSDETGTELARTTMQDSEWSGGGYGVAYSGNQTDGRSSYWDGLTLRS